MRCLYEQCSHCSHLRLDAMHLEANSKNNFGEQLAGEERFCRNLRPVSIAVKTIFRRKLLVSFSAMLVVERIALEIMFEEHNYKHPNSDSNKYNTG